MILSSCVLILLWIVQKVMNGPHLYEPSSSALPLIAHKHVVSLADSNYYHISFNTQHGEKQQTTFWNIFLIFPRKYNLTFHANHLLRRQLTWHVRSYFLGEISKNIINLSLAESAQWKIKVIESSFSHFHPPNKVIKSDCILLVCMASCNFESKSLFTNDIDTLYKWYIKFRMKPLGKPLRTILIRG